MLCAYSVLGIVPDPKETNEQRQKRFCFHGADIFRAWEDIKQNKMHCILYVGAFSGDKN